MRYGNRIVDDLATAEEVPHVESSGHRQVVLALSLFSLEILILASFGKSASPAAPPAAPPRSLAWQRVEKRIEPRLPFPQESVNAHAYLVRLIGEATPLARKREFKPLPPASLTKLLTVLLAREILAPDEWIPFSEEAKAAEAKVSDLAAGEMLQRDDAIRAALVASANDAALALEEAIRRKRGGEREEKIAAFRTLANERGRAIGLTSSHFENSTGLDAEGHLTTAEDLARLAAYIWEQHRALWEISREMTHTVVSDRGIPYELATTNELLKEFPSMVGGKTGFTDNAKGSLLFLYPVRPDRIGVVVILGSEDRFGDARAIINWLEAAFQ